VRSYELVVTGCAPSQRPPCQKYLPTAEVRFEDAASLPVVAVSHIDHTNGTTIWRKVTIIMMSRPSSSECRCNDDSALAHNCALLVPCSMPFVLSGEMAMKLARSTERMTRVSRVLYESQFTGRARRRHQQKTRKIREYQTLSLTGRRGSARK
jgi:hypothetical protein